MEKVTGIGGVFFKGGDHEKLADWYRKNLGIESKDGTAEFHWREDEQAAKKGRTVWALFPADTDYLGGQRFMINYRVSNLPRLLAQLTANGVTIEKTENFEYGSFAWIKDPEGNRIELWEPREE